MGVGFLRKLACETMLPVSAAVEPAPLSPLAVDAMNEVGIDISHQEVKDVPGAFKERFAYAIGVGDQSKEGCPIFPSPFRLFRWSLEDPATVQGPPEERLSAFPPLRNQIEHNAHESLVKVS